MGTPSRRINLAVGLASLLVMLVAVAGALFFVGESRPFAPRFRVQVTFGNLFGLKEGAPVTLSGVPVGRVAALTVDEGARKEPVGVAVLELFAGGPHSRWLTDRSRFAVVTENLFGDRHVEVTGEGSGTPLQGGERLTGHSSPSLNEMLERLQTMQESVERFASEKGGVVELKKTTEDLSASIANLREITESIRNVLGFPRRIGQGWWGGKEPKK